ncbi:MAG: hypothetical protein RI981_250 [Bacteroidota bacterium]|jgi:hypothetical protein
MSKQTLDQVVKAHIADIAILHGGVFQDPNYFPPTISVDVFESLPPILAEAVNQYETDEEKSIALLSSLTTLTAGLHGIKIPYRKKTYNCNLFQVIVGPPASNKGIALHSRVILDKVQHRLKKQYQIDKAKYLKAINDIREKESLNSLDGEESNKINIESESSSNYQYEVLEVSLAEPNPKHIILPSDISSASLIDLIEKNDGFGLIFDSEAQTILNSFKQDWGANLKSMLLKTFENEPLELARKSMRSMISIPEPRFSVLLTGNPEHLFGLVKSITNGLYSRFCIYQTQKIGWVDMKQIENNKDYHKGYEKLSMLVDVINNDLEKGFGLEFEPSIDQIKAYNQFFGTIDGILTSQIDPNFSSVVKRMGVVSFRIAAILSAIRDKSHSNGRLTCKDEDFAIAVNICSTLLKHSVFTFQTSTDSNSPLNDFYNNLPNRFNRKQALEVADSLSIKSRRMDTYLKELTVSNKLRKADHGIYEKYTFAKLQHLQFDSEEEDSKQGKSPVESLGKEPSNEEVVIDAELSKSNSIVDDDIAQFAILQTPFSIRSEEDSYDAIAPENKVPAFNWLRNVDECTGFYEADLMDILEIDGYETHAERLKQIQLALRFNKLEVNEGVYSLVAPCF